MSIRNNANDVGGILFYRQLTISMGLSEPGLSKPSPGPVDFCSVLWCSWTTGSIIPHSCLLHPKSQSHPYSLSVVDPPGCGRRQFRLDIIMLVTMQKSSLMVMERQALEKGK